ncbi:hypothetical protein V1264_000209 [Littorina saxatilis]|uniref:Peptidase A2 domain-containing protein n=1 Tax=Littorina saxatilis TaxID=31220 RepID=A0AAN9BYT2_9CAEN
MPQEQAPVKQFTASVPAPTKLEVGSNLSHNWKKFRRQWENYAIASRLSKEENAFQCAVFLATIGEDAMDIFDGLHFEEEGHRQDLAVVLKKFEDFCVGEAHEAYESYKFHSRKQEQGETIEAYIACLRQLAKSCNFEAQTDRMIRDQIVVGVREDKLREKLLERKKLSLSDCLEIGRAHETSQQQMQSMSGADSAQVQRLQGGRRFPKKDKGQQGQSRSHQPYQSNSSKPQSNGNKCDRCGKSPKHNRKDCPAREAECRVCSKRGHYAVVCRSKNSVRQVEEDDDDVILGSITSNETATVNSLKEDLWHADIEVNGQRVKFRVDTGADVSVVPERYFRKDSTAVSKTSKKLFGPGQTKINVVGQFTATLSTKKTNTVQDMYVIENLKEPLLGRPAIEALQLLERINTVETPKTSIKDDFPKLFEGLGKLGHTYKIAMKENAIPYAVSAPRRIPLPMQQKVKNKLKRLEELDVIRPVTTPTEWCAPIVVVPKANDKVRVCVDLTKLNESVRRENFPLPTTDELLSQLAGATLFSKLDCNSGFHQIPLADESQ